MIPPGKGAVHVLGEQAGVAVQAARTLKDEKKRLQQVIAACPALTEADGDDGSNEFANEQTNEQEWQLQHPELCLELLSQLKALPEGMLPGESGFLVLERDVDALAQQLEWCVSHSETWPEMGWRGREFVEERYDIHRLNERLVELYRETKTAFQKESQRGAA